MAAEYLIKQVLSNESIEWTNYDVVIPGLKTPDIKRPTILRFALEKAKNIRVAFFSVRLINNKIELLQASISKHAIKSGVLCSILSYLERLAKRNSLEAVIVGAPLIETELHQIYMQSGYSPKRIRRNFFKYWNMNAKKPWRHQMLFEKEMKTKPLLWTISI